ncbi:hypothetical protein NC651_011396 [Populus alba x Populus x berolinensis]|nr:hypothetical protein NC651_011396 [Populus alba x Populus x berolinensis]
MEMHQILFDWLRCVNDWEMVWAGRRGFLQPPDFDLKAVIGEGGIGYLDGQRVLPARAKELGFQFKYPRVKDALKTILS